MSPALSSLNSSLRKILLVSQIVRTPFLSQTSFRQGLEGYHYLQKYTTEWETVTCAVLVGGQENPGGTDIPTRDFLSVNGFVKQRVETKYCLGSRTHFSPGSLWNWGNQPFAPSSVLDNEHWKRLCFPKFPFLPALSLGNVTNDIKLSLEKDFLTMDFYGICWLKWNWKTSSSETRWKAIHHQIPESQTKDVLSSGVW